jgi:hypothetical protein
MSDEVAPVWRKRTFERCGRLWRLIVGNVTIELQREYDPNEYWIACVCIGDRDVGLFENASSWNDEPHLAVEEALSRLMVQADRMVDTTRAKHNKARALRDETLASLRAATDNPKEEDHV